MKVLKVDSGRDGAEALEAQFIGRNILHSVTRRKQSGNTPSLTLPAFQKAALRLKLLGHYGHSGDLRKYS